MKKNFYIIEIEGREGVDEYIKLVPKKNSPLVLLKIVNDKKEATHLSFEDCELYSQSLENNFNENYKQTIKKIKINE